MRCLDSGYLLLYELEDSQTIWLDSRYLLVYELEDSQTVWLDSGCLSDEMIEIRQWILLLFSFF